MGLMNDFGKGSTGDTIGSRSVDRPTSADLLPMCKREVGIEIFSFYAYLPTECRLRRRFGVPLYRLPTITNTLRGAKKVGNVGV